MKVQRLWAVALLLAAVACTDEKKATDTSATATEKSASGYTTTGEGGAQNAQVAQIAVEPELGNLFRATKARTEPGLLERQYTFEKGMPQFRASSGIFTLIPLALMTDSNKVPEKAALRITKYEPYYRDKRLRLTPEIVRALKLALVPPDHVDHTSRQTPIRNQASRGTCVAHASLAALEERPDVPDNLSEEFAYHDFMGRESSNCCADGGLRTIDSAVYLSAQGVPEESTWAYSTDQPKCRTDNTCTVAKHDPIPAAAASAKKYRITAYDLINDAGTSGSSIKNPAYLESLLADGFDIVWGTYVAWDDSKNHDKLDVVLDSAGNPASSRAGHAMLIVGYDRAQNYFIVKNSWNTTWGHSGYGHFSYDYIRTYAKYGYIIRNVASSTP